MSLITAGKALDIRHVPMSSKVTAPSKRRYSAPMTPMPNVSLRIRKYLLLSHGEVMGYNWASFYVHFSFQFVQMQQQVNHEIHERIKWSWYPPAEAYVEQPKRNTQHVYAMIDVTLFRIWYQGNSIVFFFLGPKMCPDYAFHLSYFKLFSFLVLDKLLIELQNPSRVHLRALLHPEVGILGSVRKFQNLSEQETIDVASFSSNYCVFK